MYWSVFIVFIASFLVGVLHNVIIVHPRFSMGVGYFFMHYNATLCAAAWGKKICSRRIYLFFKGVRRCRGKVWHELRSVRVIAPINVPLRPSPSLRMTKFRAGSFFLERREGVPYGNHILS
jgi:hypothetical protein